MTNVDEEFDEYGKRVLVSLRQVPEIDPQKAAEVKKQFLLEVENLPQGLFSQTGEVDYDQKRRKPASFRAYQNRPLLKALMAALLAVLVILTGSSFTVYASQSSLPGEPLYTIKSWSEDVRLSMTFSTKAKLNLTLDYTNRRVDEISSLLAIGKTPNDQTNDRYQHELDNALQLAAQLDDTQIQNALKQIKSHAVNQGMTMEQLLNTLPPQANPAIVNLTVRLAEQVQLSTYGESDPKSFRAQIHERMQKRHGPQNSPESEQLLTTPTDLSGTPVPKQDGNDNGNKMHQNPDVPGHGVPGNGKGQSTPGNGNQGPNENLTQVP